MFNREQWEPEDLWIRSDSIRLSEAKEVAAWLWCGYRPSEIWLAGYGMKLISKVAREIGMRMPEQGRTRLKRKSGGEMLWL